MRHQMKEFTKQPELSKQTSPVLIIAYIPSPCAWRKSMKKFEQFDFVMSDTELFKLKLAKNVAIRPRAEIDSQHLTRATIYAD